MLERYDVIISEGAPDPMLPEVEGEWVKYADAHATIADLQGQVAAWHKRVQEADEAYYAVGELNDALQQRVAQLEGEVEEQKRNYLSACETIYKMYVAATGREGVGPKRGVVEDLEDLQADHAHVLGLVQKLPVVDLDTDYSVPGSVKVYKQEGEGWMVHTYPTTAYWSKFSTEAEAVAYADLLTYRQSLPAQPLYGPCHDCPSTYDQCQAARASGKLACCPDCRHLPAQPAQGGESLINRMAHINDGCECRICKPETAQGHEHVWGTDGAHSNEFCKVCFVIKPQPAQGGA